MSECRMQKSANRLTDTWQRRRWVHPAGRLRPPWPPDGADLSTLSLLVPAFCILTSHFSSHALAQQTISSPLARTHQEGHPGRRPDRHHLQGLQRRAPRRSLPPLHRKDARQRRHRGPDTHRRAYPCRSRARGHRSAHEGRFRGLDCLHRRKPLPRPPLRPRHGAFRGQPLRGRRGLA